MAITTRAGKGSALTHAELDGNFTDLDTRLTTAEGEINTLEAGAASLFDGTGNLDVSSIIINSSLTETRPLIAESDGDNINSVSKLIRQGTSTGAKSALVAHTEFSVAGASGMGTGIWNTVNATDMSAPINVSGMQAEVKAYTDENNYTSEFAIYTYDKSGGAVSFGKKLSVAEDEVRVSTNGVVVIENLPTSDPVNAGQLWNDVANGGILKVSAG